MSQRDLLAIAADEFGQRLAAVTADQWDHATPCTGWSVRDLVNHVVAGNTLAVRVLEGASAAEALAVLGSALLGDDPVADFQASVAAQAAAFDSPGAMERVCHHPAGDIPGSVLLGFRVSDLALHAWDLARAIGAGEHLDDELVAEVWRDLQPMLPIISQIGIFGEGPSGTVGDDAPLQLRVLDVTGRRP